MTIVTEKTTDQPPILYAVEDGVATISFNRPHRHNALDDEATALFAERLTEAARDLDVRVILLRGEGKSFCTGRDTAVLGKRITGLSDFQHLSNSLRRKLDFLDIQKPVIAALKGHAIGGGFETALKADIRVASEDARMSLPEINWGIMTDSGGSVITTALAGPSRAKWLVMSGEVITAREALDWGLVDFVTTAEELDNKARQMALKLAAQPPMHLAMAKQLVDGVFGDLIRRGLRNEMVTLTALYKSEDYQEARAARREKREPKYNGR
jgi:enoyl-CoA hydratase/carnithine racemase